MKLRRCCLTRRVFACTLAWTLVVVAPCELWAESPGAGRSDLKKLSIEELMQVEVTSPSRKPEHLAETAAAIYVITDEDIRRAGVTTLAGALRLAPGVHVARIDGNKWAIGIRGFTSQLSRGLLVLIDGRSVYTPLFAGVRWEVQDTLLEDVERIEVIRGPGGTLWGANAVNGVINIITKSAPQTQGILATAGGGSEELAFGGARYGGKVGEHLAYRVYGKAFDRDGQFTRNTPDFDGSQMGQGGFRLDWTPPGPDRVTVQGDYYDGNMGTRTAINTVTPPFLDIVDRDADVSGGNVLGRWRRTLRAGSEATLQTYYDRTSRREASFREDRDTFDVDFQHRLRAPYQQQLIWGLAYRLSSGDAGAVPTIMFTPSRRTNHLVSGFLQDEIVLAEGRLRFIVGSKLEYNDYSGVEVQPNARALFAPVPGHSLWGAISRAVRTPSRVEQDLALTFPLDPSTSTFARVLGDGRFQSESVIAFELGYRVQPVRRLFLDLTAFYNDYENLLSIERGTPETEGAPPDERTILPFFIRNRLDGDVYGVELAADAELTDWWRMGASYSYLHLDLHSDPGSTDVTTAPSLEGSSPQNQVSVRSRLDLRWDVELDTIVRYVDNLPSQGVGSYVSLDVRCGWRPMRDLELAVVGHDLLEAHHAEFGSGLGQVDIQRGVYGKVTWRY